MEPLLSSLNPAQKEAATTIDKHVRIVAGAGSGKTRVLMARIEYLLNEVGVYPNRILAITFTNKAANEMKERLQAQVGDLSKDVRISTIHALCVRILKEDARALGYPSNFTILDVEDQKRMMKEIFDRHNVDKSALSFSKMLGIISNNKTAGVSPLDAKKMSYSDASMLQAKLYEEYEMDKDEMKAMDFDDLLLETDRLLKTNEAVRSKWQNRLDYLHVDEFQDVDPVQYSIIQSLTRDDAILCVVGDPDQTIYTWRGADVNLMLNFSKDFQPSHTVILTENYRSTAPILAASNAVVAYNSNRIPKELTASIEGDDLLNLHESITEDEETVYVARQINALHKAGIPYKDMAILYRSNFCSRSFEKRLDLVGIPYQIYGGTRFYERMEVKDILSYMKLLCDPTPEDPQNLSVNLAFSRVLNQPRRGIGAKTQEKVAAYAKEHGINMLEAAREGGGLKAATAEKLKNFAKLIDDLKRESEREEISMPDLVDIILDYTSYNHMLKTSREEERLDNIRQLQADMREALHNNPDLTMDQYMQNIALFTDRQENEKPGEGINLMTVHASKGTEYPVVFIVDLVEGIFPARRSVDEGGKDALEEERRLLYVAMTRAKKHLFVTWNLDKPYYANEARMPSRFLAEIPDEYVDKNQPEPAVPLAGLAASPSPAPQPRTRRKTYTRKVKKTTHYRKGDLIDHAVYGEGKIVTLSGDIASIRFPEPIGTKKMNVQHSSIKPKKG